MLLLHTVGGENNNNNNNNDNIFILRALVVVVAKWSACLLLYSDDPSLNPLEPKAFILYLKLLEDNENNWKRGHESMSSINFRVAKHS